MKVIGRSPISAPRNRWFRSLRPTPSRCGSTSSNWSRQKASPVAPALRRLLQLHDIVQRLVGRLEEAPDAARRLADALLVLDQRAAHVIVAMLARTDAGRDRDFGLLDQQLGKFEAAEMAEFLRHRRPGEH